MFLLRKFTFAAFLFLLVPFAHHALCTNYSGKKRPAPTSDDQPYAKKFRLMLDEEAADGSASFTDDFISESERDQLFQSAQNNVSDRLKYLNLVLYRLTPRPCDFTLISDDISTADNWLFAELYLYVVSHLPAIASDQTLAQKVLDHTYRFNDNDAQYLRLVVNRQLNTLMKASVMAELKHMAMRGSIHAKNDLGGELLNSNVDSDVNEGISHLQSAAKLGYSPALFTLGAFLIDQDRDLEAGVRYLIQAAYQGYLPAQHMLGAQFLKSDATIQDGRQILLWAAKQGYLESIQLVLPFFENDMNRIDDEEALEEVINSIADAPIECFQFTKKTVEKILCGHKDLNSRLGKVNNSFSSLQEDYIKLQSDYITLEGNYTALQTDCTSLRSECTTLQNNFTNSQANCKAQRKEIKSLKVAIKGYEDEVAACEIKKNLLTSQCTTYGEKISILEGANDCLTTEKNELTLKCESYSKKVFDLEIDLEKLTKTCNGQKDDLEIKNAALASSTTMNEDLAAELQACAQELERMEGREMDARAQILKLKEDFQHSDDLLVLECKKTCKLQQELKDAGNQLKQTQDEADRANRQIENVEERLIASQQRLHETTDELLEAQKNAADANEQLGLEKTLNQDLKAKLENALGMLASWKVAVGALNAIVNPNNIQGNGQQLSNSGQYPASNQLSNSGQRTASNPLSNSGQRNASNPLSNSGQYYGANQLSNSGR